MTQEGRDSHDAVLSVRGLNIEFRVNSGYAKAVDTVSFDLKRGEVLGILGESGSGKSAAVKGILRLHDERSSRISGEAVTYKGEDLLKASDDRMREVLGKDIAIIFQDAASSLNPAFTIGTQISELLRVRGRMTRQAAKDRAIELLDIVGIQKPEARYEAYPHQLSGGMCQRVVIASAIALNPDILIADEPTTALDVTVQAQILDLLRDLQQSYAMSTIIVSHDIAMLSEFADRTLVMYAGRIAEQGRTVEVVNDPLHPYTKGLLRSTPSAGTSDQRLDDIPGLPPTIADRPTGCAFHPRCESRADELLCDVEHPKMTITDEGRSFACHVAAQKGTRA